MKDNFKIVDNYITEETVSSHFEYIYKPKRIESHLTNLIVYGPETLNTERVRPYFMSFYRLSKIAGRYDRDPSKHEFKNLSKTLLLLMVIIVLRKF